MNSPRCSPSIIASFLVLCLWAQSAHAAQNGIDGNHHASNFVTVSISPSSAVVQVGQSQRFAATVSGTSNTAVNWLVNGTLGGNSTVGTISSFGMFTAPPSAPTSSVTVTAQCTAETSASASAAVSITRPSVSVSISPVNTSLEVGQSQQFSAAVSGVTNTQVNWLVSGIPGGNSSVGMITMTGLYTAPFSVPATSVTVTAESSASPTTSASSSVTVTQSVAHFVSLAWYPSASSVAGYNVYRAAQATGPFTKINSSLDTATVYTDNSVLSGRTYYYSVTAVASAGSESTYSNITEAIVP